MIETADLNREHVEAALDIARLNYEEARAHVPILPPIDGMPDLGGLVDAGLGVVAFDAGTLVGFMACYPPQERHLGTMNARGVFVPIHGHGAIGRERARVHSRLYQAAAARWVGAGITSHAVGLYAHDAETLRSYYENGFGLRCVDAIRSMEPLDPVAGPGFAFETVGREGKGELLDLQNLLIHHLAKSPCFLSYPEMSRDAFVSANEPPGTRYFAARTEGRIVAYIKVRPDGETFASVHATMMNICGACAREEYRGTGLFHNLLARVVGVLAAEGYTRLGVDFESFNPTARGFWLKHFTPYTHTVVRRIDERILAAG